MKRKHRVVVEIEMTGELEEQLVIAFVKDMILLGEQNISTTSKMIRGRGIKYIKDVIVTSEK